MSNIVKINKDDIREAVVSCVNRILCEAEENKVRMFFYRKAKTADKMLIWYLTDNIEYAKRNGKQGAIITTYELTLSDRAHYKDLGEGDFIDMPIDEIAKQTDDGSILVYYPDNKTTCFIADADIFSKIDMCGGDYIGTYNKKVDSKKVKIEWNKAYTCMLVGKKPNGAGFGIRAREKCATIYGEINEEQFFLGTLRICTAPARDMLGNIVLNFSGIDDTILRKRKEFDTDEELSSIHITLDARCRNCGVGTAVLKETLRNLNLKHCVVSDSFKNKWNGDWDSVDKVLTREGFSLIYYNDEYYVYYR